MNIIRDLSIPAGSWTATQVQRKGPPSSLYPPGLGALLPSPRRTSIRATVPINKYLRYSTMSGTGYTVVVIAVSVVRSILGYLAEKEATMPIHVERDLKVSRYLFEILLLYH